MRLRSFAKAAAAVAVASVAVLGATITAGADEGSLDGGGSVGIGVGVTVSQPPDLYFEVDASAGITLTEGTPTATLRTWSGSIPQVAVYDTRDSWNPGVDYWCVMGSVDGIEKSTDGGVTFAPTTDVIPDWFGWTPVLTDDGGLPGLVFAGDEVVGTLDIPTIPGNNVGLGEKTYPYTGELLFASIDPENTSVADTTGDFLVDATLFLHAPKAVPRGDYSAVLTLSLFEE